MDLTEAEDIKKRLQEYTEEPYKKDFHDPDNHNGVITLGEWSGMTSWHPGMTVRDFGKLMFTLLYLKWITNKDLLYSTGNSV